jgi:hypothetical protein
MVLEGECLLMSGSGQTQSLFKIPVSMLLQASTRTTGLAPKFN